MKKFYIIFFTMLMVIHNTQKTIGSDEEALTTNTSSKSKFRYYYALPLAIRQHIGNFIGFNTPNKHGWLPLQAATANGKIASSLFLLEHGAHTNIRNEKHPTTPLSYSTSYNYSMRSQREKDRYAIITKHLLDYGANPYLINERGQTAVHEAVMSHNIPALQAMIDKNISINVKNQFDQTPYDLAQTLASRRFLKFEDQENILKICQMLHIAKAKSTIAQL